MECLLTVTDIGITFSLLSLIPLMQPGHSWGTLSIIATHKIFTRQTTPTRNGATVDNDWNNLDEYPQPSNGKVLNNCEVAYMWIEDNFQAFFVSQVLPTHHNMTLSMKETFRLSCFASGLHLLQQHCNHHHSRYYCIKCDIHYCQGFCLHTNG